MPPNRSWKKPSADISFPGPNSSAPIRGKALGEKFFNRRADLVAQDLLGKILVRRWRGRDLRAVITETEAYLGPEDLASHASRGLTPRTKVMFGAPGRWYVYFTYGMHWMLNIVTGPEGHPAAVLIRGLDAVSGPGRLTKAFRVDGKINARKSARGTGLWIEDAGIKIPRGGMRRSPRIGVDYAGPVWAKKRLRFVLA